MPSGIRERFLGEYQPKVDFKRQTRRGERLPSGWIKTAKAEIPKFERHATLQEIQVVWHYWNIKCKTVSC